MKPVLAGATAPAISDRNSPWNEAFSFSPEQLATVKAVRPELFDDTLDPATRTHAWRLFAQSSEGRAFRWR